ncbi:MAG: glutamate--tRNA ligase family protein, partial [Wolbachia pipientis]|nr:glutamate--tRNA ligase family protein [Wolbachia pipientis]
QLLIYQALDFNIPRFAHIPLIHLEDGNKLSKRHGATNIYDYKKMGILPKAMRNYLLRLGWSHKNDEIINDEQAIKWFNLENIGRSPAHLDFKKLKYLNHYYINNMNNEDIINLIFKENTLTNKKKNYLLQGLTELKKRASYLTELLDLAQFYIQDPPLNLNNDAKQIVKFNLNIIKLLVSFLSKIGSENWNSKFLSSQIKKFEKLYNIKISNIYHSLRAPITGIMDAPGIINIMIILGKDECIRRLQHVTNIYF